MAIIDNDKKTCIATVSCDEDTTAKLKRLIEFDHSDNLNRAFRMAIIYANRYLDIVEKNSEN